MERRIAEIYGNALKDVTAEYNRYIAKWQPKVDALREAGKNQDAELLEKQILLRTKKAKAQNDMYARILLNADEVALDVINGKTPEIYATNFNYINRQVHDVASSLDVAFSAVNGEMAQAVLDDTKGFYRPTIDAAKTMKWNVQRINNQFLTGIVQGESPKEIAKRLATVTGSNASASIRMARTMTTAAENLGRENRHQENEKLLGKWGFKVRKKWLATSDERTRPHHRMLNGTYADDDGYFMFNLRYPADWECGNPAEIYNCRCTMTEEVSR